MVSPVAPRTGADPAKPVVIKLSPISHLAVGLFAFGLLVPVLTWPITTPLLVIPVALSALIVRLRTVADRDTVTARSVLNSTTVAWSQIQGLRFTKSSWARARLTDGTDLRLPAVTFSTLPLLSYASGGAVPNPYEIPAG